MKALSVYVGAAASRKGFVETFSESLGISDIDSRVVASSRIIAESLGVSDIDSKVAESFRALVETLDVEDKMKLISLVQAAWAFMILRQTHN